MYSGPSCAKEAAQVLKTPKSCLKRKLVVGGSPFRVGCYFQVTKQFQVCSLSSPWFQNPVNSKWTVLQIFFSVRLIFSLGHKGPQQVRVWLSLFRSQLKATTICGADVAFHLIPSYPVTASLPGFQPLFWRGCNEAAVLDAPCLGAWRF